MPTFSVCAGITPHVLSIVEHSESKSVDPDTAQHPPTMNPQKTHGPPATLFLCTISYRPISYKAVILNGSPTSIVFAPSPATQTTARQHGSRNAVTTAIGNTLRALAHTDLGQDLYQILADAAVAFLILLVLGLIHFILPYTAASEKFKQDFIAFHQHVAFASFVVIGLRGFLTLCLRCLQGVIVSCLRFLRNLKH